MMKEIILIALCCICRQSYSIDESNWETDEEVIESSLPNNDSASIYGTVDIVIPYGRNKREIRDSWNLCIPYSSGKGTKCLHFKRTEGILANEHTPVWFARGARSAKISYRRSQIMNKLGKMSFYQDFAAKAAVVMFHDQNRIKGFVDQYLLEPKNGYSQDRGRPTTFKLVPVPYENYFQSKAVGRRKRDTNEKGYRVDPVPTTVYPQILVQLDRSTVRKYVMTTVMQALAYWNAIDMIYSDLKGPQVKINVAGIIIPEDDYTTPWIDKARVGGRSDYLDGGKAIEALGKHFQAYSQVFPKDLFDFFFSFVGLGLDPSLMVLGLAPVGPSCSARKSQVALIRNNLNFYLVAAHELGHLLSADHDQSTKCTHKPGVMNQWSTPDVSNLEWSSCTRESIQNHFRMRRSRCLDSCPQTKPDCGNQRHSYVDEMPNCLIRPSDICKKYPGTVYPGHIACDVGLVCVGSSRASMNLCKQPEALAVYEKYCRSTGGTFTSESMITAPRDGVLCESSNPNKISACYKGKCVPVGRSIPIC